MNHNLLRPFDLEAAKRGDEICIFNLLYTPIVFCGALSNGKAVLIEFSDMSGGERSASNLRMKPLAWVEDRPVYNGDGLYSKVSGSPYFVSDGKVANWNYLTWEPVADKKTTRTVKFLAWLLPNGHLVNIAEDAAICMGYKRVPSEDKTVEVEVEVEVEL